ncbi:MAG: Na+/H+ antiporter subunit E [Deltaproteobacteria bacterium]|nr:Na+/H+ antiporter subunit E [Deltaproteobacteria bacterium]
MHRLNTFLIMFAFWILLSGKFDLFHLTLGVISSILVAALSSDLLFHEKKRGGRLAETCRFLCYIPWLLYEIVLSTLHVTFLALHPRMRSLIDPKVVTFKTTLENDFSRVTLANSITLTPGTITILIQDGEYYVHALSRKAAEGLPGEMENRVARIFKEG